MPERLEIILPLDCDAGRVWSVVRSVLLRVRPSLGESVAAFESERKKRPKPHLAFNAEDVTVDFTPVANHGHSLLEISFQNGSVPHANDWVASISNEFDLISGRLVDPEYEFWQNAEDPLEYRAKGRSYDHLPRRSNGLPPPLEKEIIDTSANPGRRRLRDGYVEAVGSHMWLGKRFWEATQSRLDDLHDCDWLEIRCDGPLTEISAAERPFRTAEGLEGRIQDDLRRLLFSSSS